MSFDSPIFKHDWDQLVNPWALIRAVILVSDRLKAAGYKTGSDDCVSFRTIFRRDIAPRILEQWGKEVNQDPSRSPWLEDFLVYTWMSWRKALDKDIPRFRRQCGLDPDSPLFE